ncbi:Protein fam49a, partial [Mortierella polycephala]
MGNFLSQFNVLVNRDNDSNVPDVQLDFENESMTDEDLESYATAMKLLEPTTQLLDLIRSYQGCGEYIRQAIGSSSPEIEANTWKQLTPEVTKLKEFYNYAKSIENCLPQILATLCIGDINRNLEMHQPLARILCHLLDFVFEFDSIKMRTPQIQNDFSYYRRCLSKGKLANDGDLRSAMDEDELANRLSMFYAGPTPMLTIVTDVTTRLAVEEQFGRSISECLATLAAVCAHIVSNNSKKPQRPETMAFCLRVMVISIVVYDHIDPQGAFAKGSPINIKSSVKTIQTYSNADEAKTLLHALKYSSKHLNDQ